MKTYEEKYKEALENFKLFREAYKTTDNSITYKEMRELFANVENSFPELIESDDERLRKAMICGMNALKEQHKEKFASIPINDCIAWLEKQGKNNMGISEATKKKLEDNLNKALEKETPESFNKFLDEQKPAWSKEDEDILNTIINHFKIDIECTDEDDVIRWLKSLKDRVQLQPMQQWSCGDEAHLHSLITHLEQWIESNPDTTGADIQGENIAWLKSLSPQPHWKPSDEQMHYLSWIANVKLGDSVVEQEVSKHLNELLEDLKKLKE